MKPKKMMSGIGWFGVVGLLLVTTMAASAAEPRPRKIYGHRAGRGVRPWNLHFVA